ncbi:MAG TPA: hypothetical protein VGC92_12645, partial [Phenylobacterium sp.]
MALAVAGVQILASRRAAALDRWNGYLRLCFDNPEYSSVALASARLPRKSVAGLADQMTPESEKYLWFLSILL